MAAAGAEKFGDQSIITNSIKYGLWKISTGGLLFLIFWETMQLCGLIYFRISDFYPSC